MSGPAKWELEAFIMTCRNDSIADANRALPKGLQNAIRGAAYQTELERCTALIVGHQAYEALPFLKNRNRIVMSTGVKALEHKDSGWWWNPSGMTLTNMLRVASPGGGAVGVMGGRKALEYFLLTGVRTFHVCRAESVAIQDGYKLFADCDRRTTVDMVLKDRQMRLLDRELIDLRAPISRSTWRRN